MNHFLLFGSPTERWQIGDYYEELVVATIVVISDIIDRELIVFTLKQRGTVKNGMGNYERNFENSCRLIV